MCGAEHVQRLRGRALEGNISLLRGDAPAVLNGGVRRLCSVRREVAQYSGSILSMGRTKRVTSGRRAVVARTVSGAHRYGEAT